LSAMFNDRSGPLFHLGSAIELPPLDDRFVDHQLSVIADIAHVKVDRREAIAAFEQLHRSPFNFRKLMETLALNPKTHVRDAVKVLRARLDEELGYDRTGMSLSPLARGVLAHLAASSESPTSDAGRRSIGLLVRATPTASQVQAALRTLMRKELIARSEDSPKYRIEDPDMKDWIAGRPEV